MNYFDKDRVTDEIVRAHGSSDTEVCIFDWDHLVAAPFSLHDFYEPRLQPVAQICHAHFLAPHLGFFKADGAYAGLSGWSLRLNNVLAVALHVGALVPVLLFPFLLFTITFAFLLNIDRALLFPSAEATGSIYVHMMALLAAACVLSGLTGTSRAWLCPVLRRIVLIVAWPVALVLLGTYITALVIGSFMLNDLVSNLTGSLPLAMRGGLMLVTYTLCLSMLYRFNKVIAICLKMTADFIRYIALRTYRQRLVTALHRFVEGIVARHPDAEIILLTHSLGTVIAADLLIAHPDLLRHAPSITWVTMGSPINRFFARFFPEMFPPAGDIERHLAVTLPNLRWINIYRVWDFVGTTLGLDTETHASLDAPSNTYRSNPIFAHGGYWGDAQVGKMIMEHIAGAGGAAHVAPECTAHCMAPWSAAHVWAPTGSLRAKIWSRRGTLATLLAALCALCFSVTFASRGRVSSNLVTYALPFIVCLYLIRPYFRVVLGCDGPGDFLPLGRFHSKLAKPHIEEIKSSRRRYRFLVVAGLAVVGIGCLWHVPYQWDEVAKITPSITSKYWKAANLRFSPNGRFLMVNSGHAAIEIFDVESGRRICVLEVGPFLDAGFADSKDTTVLLVRAIGEEDALKGVALQTYRVENTCSVQPSPRRFLLGVDSGLVSDMLASISANGRFIALGARVYRAPSDLTSTSLAADLWITSFDMQGRAVGAFTVANYSYFSDAPFHLLDSGLEVVLCKFFDKRGPRSVKLKQAGDSSVTVQCPEGVQDSWSGYESALSGEGRTFAERIGRQAPDNSLFNGQTPVRLGRAQNAGSWHVLEFGAVRSMSLNNAGTLLAVTGSGAIWVVDLTTGEPREQKLGPFRRIGRDARTPKPTFSNDDTLLAAQIDDQHIGVYRWREKSYWPRW
ncbi:hypothetical protein [Caballeronia sp. LZ019]|uniref:hypothetical protein n=1 Tax=Caballeronia sp. LZ019 TaxID=3038555 RepID=UPI0028625452|nr:hypothetical protein [Caballeronia sp. LZ019]MDR5809073.1 hypothetical protein [Caballeronia sp. LZ019]